MKLIACWCGWQGFEENGPIEMCPSCGRGIAPRCDGCSE